MIVSIFVLSCIGIVICSYGLWVETNLKKDSNYKAACDISDQISCSKAFKSGYAQLFGFSNIYKGLFLYMILALCAFFGYIQIILPITIITAAISVWFAYILFVHVQTLCTVCLCVYAVNGALLLAALYEYA